MVSRPETRPAFRHDVAGTPAAAWDEQVAAYGERPVSLEETHGRPLRKVLVVAAHPDDETLGAGGLIATMVRRHGPEAVEVVVLSDGEASHPRSPSVDPERLMRLRRTECRRAIDELGHGVAVDHWHITDGAVADSEGPCVSRLTRLVGDGRDVLLVAPWRGDGHPDHEAAGRIAAAAAARTGAELLEYPVWAWHWADPGTVDWSTSRVLALDPHVARAKRRAVACHRSQVEPLSDAPGDERLLSPEFLAHFARPVEVFLAGEAEDSTLDILHADGAEPWGADTRWYEERKRALTLAMLPRRRVDRALDVGCSTGVTARALAGRCRELLAVDASPAAVGSARRRLADLDHVTVERRDLPGDWPGGVFDLVVVSEVGYFLSPYAVELLADRAARSLRPSGTVVLCHWRHPVAGWLLDGEAVHRVFAAHLGWQQLAGYRDRDVEILLLGAPNQLPDPTR